jgi:hypothetical protein
MQMRAITIILGTPLVFGACGSSPPLAGTQPMSVSHVLYCAVSMMESEGYTVEGESQPRADEPDRGSAVLHSPSGGTRVRVRVFRTDAGQIELRVQLSGRGESRVSEETLRDRIIDRCFR